MLFDRYASRLINFAYRFLHSQSEAEDLAQEVFLRVYRGKDRYDDRRPFKPWLFSIAGRLLSNRLRDIKRHRESALDATNDEGQSLVDILKDKGPSQEEAIVKADQIRRVQSALDSLPEGQRVAILLARFEEMSLEDIGETMNLSLSAVKSVLFRARERLKVLLVPESH